MSEFQVPSAHISKSAKEMTFESMPHGAQVMVEVDIFPVGSANIINRQYYAFVLSPTNSDRPLRAMVRMSMVEFQPPVPESTQDRRKRLVAEALNRARESGRLGLTKDDQVTTVNAILAALSDEFEYDDEMGADH